MKLPWVSREAYEEIKVLFSMERVERQSVQSRYEALHALVITRGLVPEPSADPAPEGLPEVKEPSLVDIAIREEADGDHRLARYFRTQAIKERKEGKSDGDIEKSIRSWVTTEATH